MNGASSYAEVRQFAAAPGAAVEPAPHSSAADPVADAIGRRTAHGAVITTIAQAASLLLRTGSMVVLARLVLPRDFGLVAMVTAFTGFLGLLRDGGLGMAAVQSSTVTRDQTSMLFWINLSVGGLLAGICAVAAPLLARFYGEPRLFALTIVVGLGFIFNGAAIQHRAMLQRALRFRTLAAIDTISLVVSVALAVATALAGAGYWAVALMTVALPAATALGAWLATGWVPGPPRRRSGVRAMMWYGGEITLSNLIVYVAYNADKVLLGRFWGAEALGIYGRAYQLINIPIENLNSSVGLVAFPALSRLQSEPARLRQFFLKGYGLFQCLVIPIVAACLLFADDIVRVFLGPKWAAAAVIFRLLAPTVLAFAVVNPLAWVMFAAGHTRRSLKIAAFLVPIVMAGYGLGLKGGAQGVALGFSIAMALLVVPITVWATHETPIRARDIGRVVMHPLAAIAGAAAAAYALHGSLARIEPRLMRLTVETAVLFGAYAVILLRVLGRQAEYATVLRQAGIWPLRRSAAG